MKSLKKKRILLITVLALVMTASGCGSKGESRNDTDNVRGTESISDDESSQYKEEKETSSEKESNTSTDNKVSETNTEENNDGADESLNEEKNSENQGTLNAERDSNNNNGLGETADNNTVNNQNYGETTSENTSKSNPSGNQNQEKTSSSAAATKPAAETTVKPAAETATKPAEVSTTESKPAEEDNQASKPAVSVTLPINVSQKASQTAESVINGLINGSMSEFDKVKAIHDYIVNNIQYASVIDYNNHSLFTAEGALTNKVAVCQGYAEAFSLLCYKAGIQTEMVYGVAYNGQTSESHAWNIVRVDGVWYQIDTTWDDPIGGNPQYTYFLIPDSLMNENHTASSYTNKYSCTDSRYVEYGQQMTAAVYIQSRYGNVGYKFVSGEAEVKNQVTANKNGGINTFILAYDTGEKINLYSDQNRIATVINNIQNWIGASVSSGYSLQYSYQDGLKYIIIKITLNN